MDSKGNIKVTPKYSELTEMSEGYAFFKVEPTEKWGVLDKKGNIICQDMFSEIVKFYDIDNKIPVFSEGLAAIKKNEKWGFTDTKCNIVIEPKFTDVRNFSERLAVAAEQEEKNMVLLINQVNM